jgi:hypothetical protein
MGSMVLFKNRRGCLKRIADLKPAKTKKGFGFTEALNALNFIYELFFYQMLAGNFLFNFSFQLVH